MPSFGRITVGSKLLENPFLLVFDITRVKPPVSHHPNKMSSLGGLLREVVAYERSDHKGSKILNSLA